MKKAIMIFALCMLALMAPGKAQAATRGVWISAFDFKNAGLTDKSETQFRTNVKKMYSKVKVEGCNTVFFHVRAYDDAIWPSTNFSMSRYLSSTGKLSYDAMAILVSEAHAKGLSFHAWMNPYRVTYSKILNPASASSINRIVLAVKEIIDNYQVDGIHFDDYFYPSGGNKQYKEFKSLTNAQKKANVNKMVKKVYDTVKAKNQALSFGISPAGELSYCRSLGADVDTWLSKPGYVDYVVPQIYWTNTYNLGGTIVPYFTRQVSAWKGINKLNKPVYWGLALYRAGMSSSTDLGWTRRSNNIAKQIKELSQSGYQDYVLFSYSNFIKSSGAKELNNYRKQIASVKVSVVKKSVKVKKKRKIRVSLWPSALAKKVTYKSSNKKIATVSKKGMIKGRKKGTVTITISVYGKKKKLKMKVTK